MELGKTMDLWVIGEGDISVAWSICRRLQIRGITEKHKEPAAYAVPDRMEGICLHLQHMRYLERKHCKRQRES